jgi:transglutaminase-like putative cysteine protease
LILESLVRLLSWFIRKAGAWTLLTFSLLFVLALILVWVLETSIRGLENSWLPSATALGLFAGWWLARSKLRSWQAALLGGFLGFSAILYQAGGLGEPFQRLFFSLPVTKGGFFRWEGLPDPSLILPVLREIWKGVSVPLARLVQWSAGMVFGEPAYDPTATVVFWSLVVWGISTWQSWALRRLGHPLLGVLPNGALVAATTHYTGQSPIPIAAFLAGTLLLLSLDEFGKLVRRWESSGTDYSEDIRFEMTLASLGLVLVLTAAAVSTPSISIQRLVEFARRVQTQETEENGQVAESFGLRPRPSQRPPFADYSNPGLPRSHLLGSGPELSEQVVLVVQVPGASPGAPQQPSILNPRWRGLAYDRYSGRGWVTGRTETFRFPAGEPLYQPDLPALRPVAQSVRLYLRESTGGGHLLYTAGNLARVDQDTEVARRSNQDLFGVLGTAASYQAVSYVSLASEDQLRGAGQDYPGWIQERYLSLPEGVPARVLGLGRDVTGTAPTPYDRALAIERFLRTIPYSLDIPVPPPDRDVSDYFLFDLRRGYCDYYATAMVVLARAAGLPARLVTGFASGAYDSGSGSFIVTAAEAHSWVEIFFPGYGWIEFEPTAGRSPIVRPDASAPEMAEPALPLPGSGSTRPPQPDWKTLLVILVSIPFLLLAGSLAWMIYDEFSLQRLSPPGSVATLYRRLYRAGHLLDVHISQADTPHELVTKLRSRIAKLGSTGRLRKRISPALGEAMTLVEIFTRTAYSPRPASRGESEQAILAWRKLQWRLRLARLLSKRGGSEYN